MRQWHLAQLFSYYPWVTVITHAVRYSSDGLATPQGFIVLSGSLELASRQIVSGAVRICFAVIYSLFLVSGNCSCRDWTICD